MPVINGQYYSPSQLEAIKEELDDKAFTDFLVSGTIAAVTGSALLGGLAGGDFIGAAVGDLLGGLFD